MITRRELLEAAGAAAVAALAARLAPAAAARAPAFQAVAANHISYEVRNYAASRDFYRSLLGMQVAYDDGKQCSLTFGDPPNSIYLRHSGGHTGGPARVDHLAYSVAGFDKNSAQTALRRRGLAPRPDGDFAWSIRDPNGFLIQVCAERGVFPGAESPGAKPFDGTKTLNALPAVAPAAFHAVAVAISYRVPNEVGSYAKTRDFYADLLGMAVARDDGNQCDLAFGDDHLLLRRTAAPGGKPAVDSLSYAVPDWSRDRVRSELERRGLQPQPASPDAWSITDPDGFKIQLCDLKSLPASFR